MISSKIREYAVLDAMAIKERFGNKRVFFGGLLNLERLNKGIIPKEEFKRNRIRPIDFQGYAYRHGNTFCILKEDKTILVKLNRKDHIVLNLVGFDKDKRDRGTWKLFNRIAELQKDKHCKIPVAVKIGLDCVYISFPNTLYGKREIHSIKDRTFSIDMNPNFVGWSVNDWNAKWENRLITHGVFSTRNLNLKDKFIKGKSGKSTLKDKRHNEVCIIAKKLAQKAAHFRCDLAAYEDLYFNPEKKNKKITELNTLINRNWCREMFVNCFCKWLNVYGFSVRSKKSPVKGSIILKMQPEYSSTIGNTIYGDKYNGKTPDPVNASIEIGRSACEFHHQYILKDKKETKITFPQGHAVSEAVHRALEANGISVANTTVKEDTASIDWRLVKKLFDSKKSELKGLKNPKDLYRVPFDSNVKWSESSSKMSLIQHFEKSRL